MAGLFDSAWRDATSWVAQNIDGFNAMNDAQRFALVSFAYNIGGRHIGTEWPAFASALAHHQWEDAAWQMLHTTTGARSKYFSQTGERRAGTLADILATGQWQPIHEALWSPPQPLASWRRPTPPSRSKASPSPSTSTTSGGSTPQSPPRENPHAGASAGTARQDSHSEGDPGPGATAQPEPTPAPNDPTPDNAPSNSNSIPPDTSHPDLAPAIDRRPAGAEAGGVPPGSEGGETATSSAGGGSSGGAEATGSGGAQSSGGAEPSGSGESESGGGGQSGGGGGEARPWRCR
jgi:hypothetical protein